MYLIFTIVHLIPVIVAGVAFKYRRQLSLASKVSLFSFVLIYSFIMYGALITDIYLSYQLEQFDLDGDGFFTGEEVTPEQELALTRVVSDTGRTFAPLTGFVLSLGLSLIVFIAIKLVGFIKKHLVN